jgi:hypothetical protein
MCGRADRLAMAEDLFQDEHRRAGREQIEDEGE